MNGEAVRHTHGSHEGRYVESSGPTIAHEHDGLPEHVHGYPGAVSRVEPPPWARDDWRFAKITDGHPVTLVCGDYAGEGEPDGWVEVYTSDSDGNDTSREVARAILAMLDASPRSPR